MWLPLVFTSHLHDILVVHLFNAGLPCMASARALARTQPVASVTHWLPCEAVHSASDLSRRSHLLILKLRGPYEVDCVPAWQDSKLPQPTRKGWLGSSLCENQRESAICSPQVWNGYGTVSNGVWNKTARSSTALPPRSTSLSKLAVWSENSAARNS